MSPDPGSWESQTAHQESQQDPSLTPEDKAGLQREKEAEEKRKRAEMEAEHQKASDQLGAWAHWEYNLEEWALFEKVDWMPIRLTFWGLVSGWVVSPIAPVLPWFILPLGNITGGTCAVLYLLGLLAWCVLLPLMLRSLLPYIEARRRRKARRQGPRTVTFSREGVWEAGTFFPLNKLLDAKVKKVTLTSDPPVLHFRLEIRSTGKYWDISGTSSTLHVPIPRGQEEEAGLLLKRFQTEVIEAQQLKERLNHPPEPRLGRQE